VKVCVVNWSVEPVEQRGAGSQKTALGEKAYMIWMLTFTAVSLRSTAPPPCLSNNIDGQPI